jgi:hypothetical protein
MGAAPTHGGVAWLKAAGVVEMQEQQPCDGATDHTTTVAVVAWTGDFV